MPDVIVDQVHGSDSTTDNIYGSVNAAIAGVGQVSGAKILGLVAGVDVATASTARLREQGFADIAEGTVYAVLVRVEQRGLVDVEKVPSEKGPPRKVYSLNGDGRDYLDEFWRTWSFLSERLDQLREGGR